MIISLFLKQEKEVGKRRDWWIYSQGDKTREAWPVPFKALENEFRLLVKLNGKFCWILSNVLSRE